MPAAAEGAPAGGEALGTLIPEWDRPDKERLAPACLGKVPRDMVKNFPHTKRVGSYLVGKMINKGSFAKVMEGLHICTGEKVAIKVIDKKKAKQDSYVLKNMKREPRIHQMIRHPNIVQLYETLETENSYYMVMELCLRGDLMDRVCDRKRLEEREARRYTRQIMSAVEHLHRHGVVHRDLKIENFLLDECNNIKIVDFGLSNTLKAEALSMDLLTTQCGSPAYAAPELLSHRKYGPKVDVWSVGVSTFAMLTGTLPFTVEPFNIKQLHQKMVDGDISTIPSDISKAAVQFVHRLLEPDPDKRPGMKEAMGEKWLDEGYVRRPLTSLLYKNRLQPDELNPAVLNYMTESLGYGLSDVMHTLINNRPSAITAAYWLLVKKLARHQKGIKAVKKETMGDRSSKPSSKPLRNQQIDTASQSDKKRVDDTPQDNRGNRENIKTSPSVTPVSVDPITDEDIAITLDNKELLFPEVSTFAERELVHLSPPKCSCKEVCGPKLSESAPCDTLVNVDMRKDVGGVHKPQKPQELRPTLSDSLPDQVHHLPDDKLEKLQTFHVDKRVSPRILLENRGHSRSPAVNQDTRFKDILQAMDNRAPALAWRCQEREGRHFSTTESAQMSPLPKLRHAALKDNVPRKITWVGVTRHSTGGSPFLLNGARAPVFPSARQQTLIIKSLRHSKAKAQGGAGSNAGTRNAIQLRTSHRVADLNLPLLSPAFHSKADKKSELLRMDFG